MRNYFAGACLVASTGCAVALIITQQFHYFAGGMLFGVIALFTIISKGGKND